MGVILTVGTQHPVNGYLLENQRVIRAVGRIPGVDNGCTLHLHPEASIPKRSTIPRDAQEIRLSV